MLRIQGKPPVGGPPAPGQLPAGGPPMPPPGGPQAGPPPGGGPPPQLLKMLAGGGAPPDGGPDAGAPDDPKGSRYDAEKVSQPTSGYMGPDAGPFACGNCFHFQGPNACAIVQGKIDAGGCCNLFDPSGDQNPDDQGGSPDDQGAGGPPAPTLPLPTVGA